jgi:hypothetical protein
MKSTYLFSDNELAACRTLLGITVDRVQTCHPWFDKVWKGSRRLDLYSGKSAVGFAVASHTPDDPNFVGEVFSLRVLADAHNVRWPVDHHKGIERKDDDEDWQRTRIITSMAIRRQTLELEVDGHIESSLIRDIGFTIQCIQVEGGQPWTLMLGLEVEQNDTIVGLSTHVDGENRYGIHCSPGNPIVGIRPGMRMVSTLSTVPISSLAE